MPGTELEAGTTQAGTPVTLRRVAQRSHLFAGSGPPLRKGVPWASAWNAQHGLVTNCSVSVNTLSF